MAFLKLKKKAKILVVVTDPFNKVYVEKALEGVPYTKLFDQNLHVTYYELLKPRRDGAKFCETFGNILVSNHMKFAYESLEKNNGNLVFHDEVPENA